MKKKLSTYAKEHGMSYRTAYNWFKNGKIKNATQMPSGMILVLEEDEPIKKHEFNVVYARVSSSEDKKILDDQADRVLKFASANGWQVHQVIKEIGSGLNDQRHRLNTLMLKEKPTRVVVEHKDRLTRFGFNYLETLWGRLGTEVIVINNVEEEGEQDLVQDFVSIITSYCARIYGKRRSKRNTEKLIEHLKNEKEDTDN